jgi:hypothetical protein
MSKREQAANGREDGKVRRHGETVFGPMVVIQRYIASFMSLQESNAPRTRV